LHDQKLPYKIAIVNGEKTMSVKKLSSQRSLFEAKGYFGVSLEKQKSVGMFVFFREKVWPKLVSLGPQMEKMYCEDNGRPGVNPVKLLAVTILQYMERAADRDAAEQAVCDLRWRIALNMDLDEEGFDPTVLVRFRDRLREHRQESVAFDAALQAMREAGYLKDRKRVRVDSTHVLALVAEMSRLECVREAIRLALETLEPVESLSRPVLWPQWWERYVETRPDPKAKKDVLRLKMDQAGEDAESVLSWVKSMPEELREIKEVTVLGRVFEENFERMDGALNQRRAQPAGAVHNPHDPEAQWSTKSTTKEKDWVGYKAQVAETAEDGPGEKGEPTKGVILAIVTQEARASDKSALPVVEGAMEAAGEAKPEVMYADAGYSSGAELARAEEEGRELKAPVQPSCPERDGRYPVEDFNVSVANRTAKCPAGQEAGNFSRLTDGKTGKATCRIEWKGSVCQACDKKDRCLGEGQGHRTLLVGEHHDHVQARRREQATEEFKRDMKHRNGIEGTISELTRGYGMRRCRYRGQARTRLQNAFIGAACNIKRWFRRTAWEAKRAVELALSEATPALGVATE
jgi:transposase